MRRAAPSLPVSPNVLRHFAVLTLVITGGIAMFANGENEGVLAEQVRQRQMRTEELRAERERATQHTVVIDGLRVAPGTRIAPADVGDEPAPSENINPAMPPLADFPMQGAPVPAGPVGMGPGGVRDGKGVPPPGMIMRLRPKPGGKPGQAQPAASQSRPPSEEDVNAFIQASAMRAGKAATGD